MTLCIAAECEHEGKPAIVLCCDFRAQRGTEFKELVGSDDVNKIREITDYTSALLAGSETEADRLLTACDAAKLSSVELQLIQIQISSLMRFCAAWSKRLDNGKPRSLDTP